MIDEVTFEAAGGRGGGGLVSFRREKFVPKGGPDGGDGGRGGDVIFVADPTLSTLSAFRDARRREAGHGAAGGSNQRRGASGADLRLRVPVGSVVWQVNGPGEENEGDGEPLADLDHGGATAIVARGGRGGWGNKRFATPTRRTPRFAQHGAEGQHRAVRVELKLLADVGLVGLPNAGKSTLLRAWSRAVPKVASYPFTTLEPELGVVELGYDAFVAADMPGLIEGASRGVGLGHEFLRHIERTRVLVHLLDATRDDALADMALINAELEVFGHGLAEKPQIIALNKMDHPDARAYAELFAEQLDALERPWFAISGATGEGTAELARRALLLLREQREREVETPALPVLRPRPRPQRFYVERAADGTVLVSGRTPEWLAATLDLDQNEARQEFFARLRRLGIGRALTRLGVHAGDTVRIGETEVEWEG